jgi:hypothetical protein
MNPVDREVFLVHSEYFADTFSLGNADKRCVCKIHRTISIFPQQFTDARQIAQTKAAAAQPPSSPASPIKLPGPPTDRQQVHRFG